MGSTPAALGLNFEPVTLTTTDGVDLAAWYLPGTNGAGVVVMHGAGSTRSDVLDQAAVLVDGGYAVVLIDARGHGDSDGTAMDFGWYGDLDIAAGTTFLASRADIDRTRIGVVGFSMGGEEAIGAAATDPLIRAVVAEGATGRQAADKDMVLRHLRVARLAPGTLGERPRRHHRLSSPPPRHPSPSDRPWSPHPTPGSC